MFVKKVSEGHCVTDAFPHISILVSMVAQVCNKTTCNIVY